MYTECPHCHTLFRIRMDQLAAADGHARCSRCAKVFDALSHLHETVPGPPEQPARAETRQPAPQPASATTRTTPTPTPTLWARDRDTTHGHPETVIESSESPADRESEDAFPFEIPENLPDIEPSAEESGPSWQTQTEPPPRARPLAIVGWALGIVALLVLALGQTVWWAHDSLAEYPLGRRLTIPVCRLLGCKVPERRAPERIRVLSRDISPHPSEPDALLVILVMANETVFPQPFPLLQIVLFDDNENPLGQRRFTPEEYLETTHPPLMKPDHAVYVKLELVDPGTQVTGFRMEFL